jgi:hypothetical protein
MMAKSGAIPLRCGADEAHIKVLSSKDNQKWYQVAMVGI